MRYCTKKPVLFISILIILFIFTGDASGKESLKVGVYSNVPLVCCSDEHEPQGILIDILEYIAEEEDWELEYVKGSFADTFTWLNDGEIDLLPAVAFSIERAETILFNHETVLSSWATIYAHKNSDIESL